MDPIRCEFLVVGGGIVGLATAAVLSKIGQTILVERERDYLQHTSSRNSGVVHAGIYYPPNSLKTRFCMQGNANIWNLVSPENKKTRGNLTHIARRCGKWIGAVDAAEEAELHKLAQNMTNRNIPFRWVPRHEISEKEPLLAMTAVIESTNTGIVDVTELGNVFRAMIDASSAVNGSLAVTGLGLTGLEKIKSGDGATIRATCNSTDGDDDSNQTVIIADKVIASMGNYSNDLWAEGMIGGGGRSSSASPLPIPPSLATYHCKGRYVSVTGKSPVSRLVYPCPLPNLKGLGTHSVITMDDKVIFGPDAVYVEKGGEDGAGGVGNTLSPSSAGVTPASSSSHLTSPHPEACYAMTPAEEEALVSTSYTAIKRYIPTIQKEQLFANFAGVRPKLSKDGEAARDFVVQPLDLSNGGQPIDSSSKGADNEVNCVALLGIESPGLTSSTAIAEHVANMVAPQRAASRAVRDQLPWVM